MSRTSPGTMGLSPEQVYELSRLKTGVCAIYQKDWTEAVLCQVDKAGHEEATYSVPADFTAETRLRETLAEGLRLGGSEAELGDLVAASALSGKQKIAILQALRSGDKESRGQLATSSADPGKSRRRQLRRSTLAFERTADLRSRGCPRRITGRKSRSRRTATASGNACNASLWAMTTIRRLPPCWKRSSKRA